MSWEAIQAEIDRQGEIEELWSSLVSYDLNDYPQLKAELSFRTVNLGRQQGYTSYIVNNARNGDIIVSVNMFQSKNIEARLAAAEKKCITLAVGQTSPLRGEMEITPHTVWFDNFHDYRLPQKSDINEILTCITFGCKTSHYPRIMRMG